MTAPLRRKNFRKFSSSFFSRALLQSVFERSGYQVVLSTIFETNNSKYDFVVTFRCFLLQNIENDDWYPESSKEDVKSLVNLLKPQLVQFVDELMLLLTEYYSIKAVLKNIYSIAVLNELMQELKE